MTEVLDRLAASLRERYTIERQIGAGGMATVYLARDLKHDRKVAIKVLRPELATAISAARFLAEIRTTANLQHPHILPLHDSGEADGSVFYVMPFVDGETLRDRLARERRLPIDDAIGIANEVADALQYAHDHGVIHRDIKPENILLQGGHALVADFGIALDPNASGGTRMTETGMTIGTPSYMSPEQATGERTLDARTDIYAMGCVLYEMLVGDPPFVGPTPQAIIARILTGRPPRIIPRRAEVPGFVEAAVLKSLASRSADRFSSAREFAAALRDTGSTSRSGVVWLRRVRLGPLRWAGIVGLVALGLAAAAGVWVVRRSSASAEASRAGDTGPRVTVLITGIENRTGDETFDALLPELLATTLDQSRTVSVYPRSNLPFVLRRMQRKADTPIDEAIGRDIAAREGLSAVVVQSLTKLGSSFVLVVRAVLPDGRPVASTREVFTDLSELPARMDAVGIALRAAFGESATALAAGSVPLDQVTSRSLDAVRFYSQGRQRLYAGDPRGAIVLLRRAVELDPEFGSAHGALGVAYTNLQDQMSAAEHLRIAASLASREPESEREKILGDFAMVRRDFLAACPHYEVLVATRPRDVAAHLSLGWCSAWKLDFATAVSETERAFELQPSPRTQLNRAMVAFLGGDLQKAIDNAEAVRAQAPTLMQAWYVVGKALMARGDLDTARALYERMVAQGGDMEVEGHSGLSDVARSTGRLDDARIHFEAALSQAVVHGNVSAATSAATELAELALEQGRRDRFRAAMARVARMPSDPWLVYRVGRAWARGGRSDDAARAITAIDSLSIGPSRQHDALKALLRAEMALADSQVDDAVREGEAAVRLEPSTVAYETLARAYRAAHRDADAARSFEQIVSRPQERCESYDPPACYRVVEAVYWLGRLKDDAGDRAGAEPLLRRFVASWAGAKGQPMLEDAQRRLGETP